MKILTMHRLLLILVAFLPMGLMAQDGQIKALLIDNESNPIIYANVVLHSALDSSIVKVETSDEQGVVLIKGIAEGQYFLKASYIGYNDISKKDIQINSNNKAVDLGKLTFEPSTVQLEEAVITASRVMVEIKPDRTVFNVDGTINSAGDNAMGLLRKAPGVLVDNNDNISVLSRSGVLVYVDGRRLPLTGDDLTNYLQNLPAEQIDKIDIITNPGAKYEAEGNAGIIDIRLKKDKNLGYSGTVGINASQGRYAQSSINTSGNYRNKKMNVFATLGGGLGDRYHEMNFTNNQNGFVLDESNLDLVDYNFGNFKLGTDFFVNDKHTVGFLVSGGGGNNFNNSSNNIDIATAGVSGIDSILSAKNLREVDRNNLNFNLNYAFSDKGQSANIDLDYGRFRNDSYNDQPNTYFNPSRTQVLSVVNTAFATPVEIDILTFKVDYEKEIWKGKFGIGTKLSSVGTDNTFLFYDFEDEVRTFNERRSNEFEYTENVYAGYVSYGRPLTEKVSFSAGLRSEYTDATGNLMAFLASLQEPPVNFNYLSFFPSLGLTYQLNQMNALSVNYGRRINRPDYNVLNPFNIQSSELSFQKGNPFLRPEIVNNVEVGYTLMYRYNFKLAYSQTSDQITRLIAPDDENPKAGFITWENLARQEVYSMNISAPIEIQKWWNMYINFNAAYINNQADYGDGAVVDVQAATYSVFQQSTFSLFKGLKGEISGYYSGPGVWGGVFRYGPQWSLNLGLQKKFLDDKLNVRLSASDLFYTTGWQGTSEFNGLTATGNGQWDSRRVALSLNYNFGNSNVKSRKRKTGIEEEAGRVGN